MLAFISHIVNISTDICTDLPHIISYIQMLAFHRSHRDGKKLMILSADMVALFHYVYIVFIVNYACLLDVHFRYDMSIHIYI